MDHFHFESPTTNRKPNLELARQLFELYRNQEPKKENPPAAKVQVHKPSPPPTADVHVLAQIPRLPPARAASPPDPRGKSRGRGGAMNWRFLVAG